jgi:DMSO/TMAO reductase YedYZ molybdopterin-dependent catalytic subunit
MTIFRRARRRSLGDFKPQLEQIERRLFLKQGLSLGALSLLSGCTLKGDDAIDRLLWSMSRWNDRVQAALFNPNRLAPSYSEAEVTSPFPFNAYYEEALAPVIDGTDYRLALSGLITDKRRCTIPNRRTLPQVTQITRHVCVEGWSAIGKWGGVPFRTFLERVGDDLTAKYIGFQCADKNLDEHRYADGVALANATRARFPWKDRGDQIWLTSQDSHTDQVRVRKPEVRDGNFRHEHYPGGYWEKQDYNWFSGS